MTDLSRILNGLFEGLGDENVPAVPTLPTSLPTFKNTQPTDLYSTSHTSRNSHVENDGPEKNYDDDPNNTDFSSSGVARTSSCVEDVGSVGTVGSGAKTLAVSTSLLFPQETKKVGSVGREGGSCERPALDLNRAGPQLGDWWDGDHLAALAPQLVPAPVLDESLPIQPAEVQAGVERELRALAALGRTGPDALRDAIAITAAKIRNAPALIERQTHDGRCHACGEPLDGTRPEVAILQAKGGSHLWVHAGECHSEHSRRRAVLVEAIMAAAGYGADRQSESAA